MAVEDIQIKSYGLRRFIMVITDGGQEFEKRVKIPNTLPPELPTNQLYLMEAANRMVAELRERRAANAERAAKKAAAEQKLADERAAYEAERLEYNVTPVDEDAKEAVMLPLLQAQWDTNAQASAESAGVSDDIAAFQDPPRPTEQVGVVDDIKLDWA